MNTHSDTSEKRQQLLRKLMREQGLGHADDDAAHGRIRRRPAGMDCLPQSCAQRRLWFLDRLAPGNPFYTVSVATLVAAEVDVGALQQALDDLVRRHEVLRTTFTERDGQTLQCIGAPAPAAFDHVDLAGLPASQRKAEAERLVAAENTRSFNLATGPLMVARLVSLARHEHWLLLTLHHIVCDGWSLRVLSHELLALYTAHASRQPPALAELPIQYADFTLWQNQRLGDEGIGAQLEYWRRTLAGAPELQLIADRVRPAVPSYRGGMVALSIGQSEAQAIARLSVETNATPFIVLMAAYMVLLGRLSSQDDFVVGTPFANRTKPELEPLIGFFVNTLVLRADLGGEPTFRAMVARVRDSVLDAFSNQDVPFERLVEELAPQRMLGRNPLFQAIFQLFSAHDGAAGEAVPIARQRGTAKFDLRLDLWPVAQGYAGELEYSDDIFDPASAELIATQYGALLAALLRAPDQAIGDADAADPAERRLVVETFNATTAAYPADVGLDRLFRDVARIHGNAPALRFADAEMSYAELDAASDGLACRLARRGVCAGDAVAILLERSAAMVVAWLAVLKLGAAYVPLDVEQPPARLAAMVADAGCRLALSAAGLRHLLPEAAVAVELVDAMTVAAPVEWPVVAGADVAHVLFTSGSTGRPKGVRIAHRGVARLTRGVDWVEFRAGERVGQTANPAFDAATYEVWSALLNGCTLIGIGREALLSAEALEESLVAERIDHLFLTTALFTRHAAARPQMFAPLRSLLTGGAKADVRSFRSVLAAGAPARLFNAYGPTETTVLGSVWRADTLPEDAPSVPIGRPVTNTSCYVLDARRRPLPRGMPGQLYIGGPGVALGYVNQPELSARQFVADPWRLGGMLYATGDKVRWRHDGQLEFLGRDDDQVKVRGFRVEPEEIASVLESHPTVRGAVVVARERCGEGALDDEQSLVAYVELKDAPLAADGAADSVGAADALVEHWRSLYDTVLYSTPAQHATFNTSGWNDSATGAALPDADMDEQVSQTVERARATGATRVLEIGCGTGLLLFRLAPHCKRYVGTDLAPVAIDYVRRTAAAVPEVGHAELFVGAANDLAAVPEGQFDLVLLNSVVQYFPSFEYLVQVVQAACARLAPGGKLYLGDLRHQALLPAFYADVLLARAPANAALPGLRTELTHCLEGEQELALAPGALQVLCDRVPGLRVTRIELKRGTRHNELSRFRYDAFLTWQARDSSPPVLPLVRDWRRDLDASVGALRAALVAAPASAFCIGGVANARVVRAQRCARAIAGSHAADAASLRAALDVADPDSVDPEQFWALGAELGRPVRVTWNADDAALFDVLVLAPGGVDATGEDTPGARAAALPLGELVTDPIRGRFMRSLVPALKAHVADRLPPYMWPDQYVLLKELPLSANGKIDKASLPPPARLLPRADSAAARSGTERRLAELWTRLLGVEVRGVGEHFFNDLGGHSLLATQVMSRVRNEFGVELPLRVIFEGPTIAELARAVDAMQATGGTAGPGILVAADDLAGLDVDALDEAALDAALARVSSEAP